MSGSWTSAHRRDEYLQAACLAIDPDRVELALDLTAGIAVAEVVDGRCTACQIVLRLQYFQDLKRGESILSCESCQRILYWNPPQSLEGFGDGTRVAMS